MSIQYATQVVWDSTLIDLEFTDASTAPVAMQGLVKYAVKTTTGAPTATAGKFIPGAFISNAVSGVSYQNTGTTASPVWSVIDVSSGGLPSLADGKIWVGNGSAVATAVTMSGDVTISNTGVSTIGASTIDKAMLSSGISASHIVKFGGQHTTVGGGAAEAITVTGALVTDLAFVQLVDDGTNNVSVLSAAVTADTLTVTFSADPGNDAVINYQLIRATA